MYCRIMVHIALVISDVILSYLLLCVKWLVGLKLVADLCFDFFFQGLFEFQLKIADFILGCCDLILYISEKGLKVEVLKFCFVGFCDGFKRCFSRVSQHNLALPSR